MTTPQAASQVSARRLVSGGLFLLFFLWQNHTGFKTRDDASENSPTISGSEKTLAMARLAFGLQKFFVGPC
jgi:hypothetical protein